MKLGINAWALPKDWDMKKIFKSVKEAGFDSFEVVVSEDGPINLESTEEDMQKIKKLADDNGIEISSVASALGWKYVLTDNDNELVEKGKFAVKKSIEIASWLGCDTVLVVPGKVTSEVPYDIAYDRTIEWINEMEPFAREKKVVIGIENVWNDFLLSPFDMRNLIDEIDSPYVKVYFDVGNVAYNGFAEQWIRILGKRIEKIHLKDFNRGNNAFVDLLTGTVNYPAVMESLKEVGYNGYLTAEVSLLKGHPELGLKNVASCMKAIVK